MTVEHVEILVEEPSMEAFLRAALPSILGDKLTFEVYPYQGKSDLLGRLEDRLRGYASWLPSSWRILVVVDRDDEDCLTLKSQMEGYAERAGLATPLGGARLWQVCFRITIEELEAWYFGEWEAVREAYPRMPQEVVRRAPYRHCDAVGGGTWEAFEREAQRQGYFRGGLRKIEAARAIGSAFRAERCTSPSFACLARSLNEISGVDAVA